MNIDTSKWKPVGESSNSRYYEIEPYVLGAVPNEGAKDDLGGARDNVRFQMDHFRKLGRGGVVVVFFDRLVSQDKDARRVYQIEPDPELMRGTALVGGTPLGRAIASFFLGLARPRIPVKMFSDLDGALVWARELNDRLDRQT